MFAKKIILLMLLIFLILSGTVGAQPANTPSTNLIINLPSRTIELYVNGEFIKAYPVAIGKPSTPTPTGNYNIINKEINPWWFPPGEGYSVPSGPSNPLGYRWMGFGGNYGVHGTNAPWSIGGAVSNGCVRMQEEDVEELYELVPIGTPLTITYDRIKIRVTSRGEASLGIYPDIYGYGDISLKDVKDQLAAYNLTGIANDDELLNLIQEQPDCQIVLAQLFNIKINNLQLTERGIITQNTLYVSALAMAEKLKLNVLWNPENETVSCNSHTVPAIVKGSTVYIAADQLPSLFGAKYRWLENDNLLDVKVPMVYLNGNPITADIQKVNNILAVNILNLAESLNIPCSWNNNANTFTVRGKSIPVFTLNNKPYLPITKIYEYFKAYVYWNELNNTIELTYPFKGGND